MECKKCGNEIKEEEIFCSKCGAKINDKSEPIRIKFTYFIIAIIAIIFTISIGILISNNSSSTINANNKSNQSIENIAENANVNKVLDVIDQDKMEFKIDAKTLAETIIQANDEMEEQERSALKTSLVYTTLTQTDPNTGKEAIIYTLNYEETGTLVSYPIMLVANADTNNIYRICVYHPFLNSYGTEINSSAVSKNYKLLSNALNEINQSELSDTIYEIENCIADYKENAEEGEGISSDFNIKGVYLGAVDGPVNNYGNKEGMYFFYATR